LNKYFRAGTYP